MLDIAGQVSSANVQTDTKISDVTLRLADLQTSLSELYTHAMNRENDVDAMSENISDSIHAYDAVLEGWFHLCCLLWLILNVQSSCLTPDRVEGYP